jgi:transposase
LEVSLRGAALDRFYRWADGVGVAELSRLARTVRAWEAEVLALHATGGCSNGATEAVNLLIKKVKRVGHGFRNFTNYRLRLLLHCVTWQISQTARLRGRSHAGWREPPTWKPRH